MVSRHKVGPSKLRSILGDIKLLHLKFQFSFFLQIDEYWLSHPNQIKFYASLLIFHSKYIEQKEKLKPVRRVLEAAPLMKWFDKRRMNTGSCFFQPNSDLFLVILFFLNFINDFCYFDSQIVLTFCEKKNVLVIKKNFWNSRLKAENLKFFVD